MNKKGLFITGTGTGIGKTVAASAIAHLLVKGGYDVGVMKPVQTGAKKKDGVLFSKDLDLMRKMANVHDPDWQAMPYAFSASLSPYHAAVKAKMPIELAVIASMFKKLQEKSDMVIVEGAGGLMVPLTETELWPDLVRQLDIPIVIVTHPELGMIHQTLSAVLAAQMYGLECAGIMVVETKKKKHPEVDTQLLEKQTGLKMLGLLPYTACLKKKPCDYAGFRAHVEKNLDPKQLIDFIEQKERGNLQKRLEKSDRQNIWHPFTQMREWEQESMLIIDSASGQKLKDLQGRTYYDGHSSYWVTVHGHCEPRLVKKLARQAARLEHSTFLGLSNRPAIELAEKLVQITPPNLTKVFYSDNGSTAVEVALKMAFQYQSQKKDKKPKKKKFVALGNAYHGDTLGAVSVGGIEMYKNIYRELLVEALLVPSPYCYRCPIGREYPDCTLACASEMEQTIAERHEEIAAFVIEPMVQCPGGIITAPHGYLKKVRELCDRYDILMIADEVAVGFGRTGRMFACEHEEVQPDLMALAKGLAGGMLPLAATLATQEIYEAFLGSYDERKTFFHGHTFTGHPLGCATALENITMMEENKIVESLEEKSQFLRDELVRFENLPHVGDVRLAGLIVGIELVKDTETKEPFTPSIRTGHKVAMEARKNGLLVRPLGDVMVLFPILSAKKSELKKMTGILYESIAAVTGSFEGSKNL